MVSQLRLAHRAGHYAVRHRRLLATTPPPVVPAAPPLNANTTIPRPTPIPLDPNAPPPLATAPPLVGVPPPPPPPPPRRTFRRLLILTALGVLTFYPVSGWLSSQNEAYRDFFVTNVPGGEAVADYADDHDWESFGFGTVSKKAVEGWQKVTGEDKKPNTTQERVAARAREVEKDVKRGMKEAEGKAKAVASEVESKAESAVASVKTTASDVADKAKATASAAVSKAKEEGEKAKSVAEQGASRVETKTSTLADRAVEATQQATDKAVALATTARDKIAEATSNAPFNFSEGVEGMVREAEKALTRGEEKIEQAVGRVEDTAHRAVDGPRGFLDAQRPRDVDPRNVKPAKPTYEGQEVYTSPLPLGFEPPPGYYVAPPPKAPKEPAKETLPLLVPKVKEFGASEPIISQLASTIDSLTQSLSTPTSSNPNGILTKAHDDLSALSQRLDEVKRAEKERLEKTLAEKAAEFQETLRSKDEERAQGEQGLKQTWETERRKMVDEWRGALETELESQRQGIEQRLREEVVSQGIELQRRWLRSIKSQVETERGGRLAKLDTLTTSLKQLERITIDNSATLDDNVRLHKIWSALRAVQAKTESGDAAFDDELRVLKSLSSDPLASTTLSALESSGIPQTGVKSYAALGAWFSQSVAPRCQSASLVPAPEQASVLSHLASATISKVMFSPKAGLVSGDDVAAILARAEWCLGEKDLDGAAREVNSLKGWPGKLAGDWLREARRRLEVQQALEIVGTEATLNSLLLI